MFSASRNLDTSSFTRLPKDKLVNSRSQSTTPIALQHETSSTRQSTNHQRRLDASHSDGERTRGTKRRRKRDEDGRSSDRNEARDRRRRAGSYARQRKPRDHADSSPSPLGTGPTTNLRGGEGDDGSRRRVIRRFDDNSRLSQGSREGSKQRKRLPDRCSHRSAEGTPCTGASPSPTQARRDPGLSDRTSDDGCYVCGKILSPRTGGHACQDCPKKLCSHCVINASLVDPGHTFEMIGLRPSGPLSISTSRPEAAAYQCYCCQVSLSDSRYICGDCEEELNFCSDCRHIHASVHTLVLVSSGHPGGSLGEQFHGGEKHSNREQRARELGRGTGGDFSDEDELAGAPDDPATATQSAHAQSRRTGGHHGGQIDSRGSVGPQCRLSKESLPPGTPGDADGSVISLRRSSSRAPSIGARSDLGWNVLSNSVIPASSDLFSHLPGRATGAFRDSPLGKRLVEAMLGAAEQVLGEIASGGRGSGPRLRGMGNNALLAFEAEDAQLDHRSRRRWDDEDKQELQRLKDMGLTDEEISTTLCRTVGAVRQQWKKQG